MPKKAAVPVTTVTYTQAILSWCSDLTDPKAAPEPLAVVLVARHEAARSVVIVMRQPNRFTQLDLTTRTIITNTPKHLARLVSDAARRRKIEAPLQELLDHAQDSLAGNIAVSARRPPRTTTVTVSLITSALFDLASATLREQSYPGTEARVFYSKLFQRLDHV